MRVKPGDASVELMTGDRKSYGSIAKKLLNYNFDVNALRTNDTLLFDEWKELDSAIIASFQQRLTGVADLLSRNLVYNVKKGLAATVLGFQDASDVNDAEMNMDGINRGQRDRQEYNISYLPLPIIHKDFQFSIREIQESRNGSRPLDTSMAELCARKIAEKAEDLLFNGSSLYSYGGGTIYGYTDFPNANSFSLVSGGWAAATGEQIIADIIEMKQVSINDRRYGPWVLYIPTNYESVMDNDFKSNSDKTTRQRILEIGGIQDVKVSDTLSSDNVLLIQMQSDTARIVQGLSVKTVQWDIEGGMAINFKVMAIIVPQIRADQSGRSGIVHGS